LQIIVLCLSRHVTKLIIDLKFWESLSTPTPQPLAACLLVIFSVLRQLDREWKQGNLPIPF
jgi:hypothetical protein